MGADVRIARPGASQGEAVHSDGATVDLPRLAPELAAGAARGSVSRSAGLRTRVGAGVGCVDRVRHETGGVV